jgi:putative membrane protein
MKLPLKSTLLSTLALVATSASVQAADVTAPGGGWHANSLVQAIGYMLLFALIGILTAIAGYVLFDKCTPGNLHKEIVENKNTAAAMIGGAVILGVCIIVAAAMLG